MTDHKHKQTKILILRINSILHDLHHFEKTNYNNHPRGQSTLTSLINSTKLAINKGGTKQSSQL